MAERQLKHKGVQDSYDLLTDREKEVLQLIAVGKTNKDVATLLDLGPLTVESHRAHLMQKLSLHSTADIVLYAVRKVDYFVATLRILNFLIAPRHIPTREKLKR